jgi:hypothetical protein
MRSRLATLALGPKHHTGLSQQGRDIVGLVHLTGRAKTCACPAANGHRRRLEDEAVQATEGDQVEVPAPHTAPLVASAGVVGPLEIHLRALAEDDVVYATTIQGPHTAPLAVSARVKGFIMVHLLAIAQDDIVCATAAIQGPSGGEYWSHGNEGKVCGNARWAEPMTSATRA